MDAVFSYLSFVPHRMVFVSSLSLIIFLVSIFYYTKVYPKKKIPYPLLLLGFSILPIISILRPGSYESGDLTINVAKTISFYDNLRLGNFIPRWSGELNATYGYPNFIFAYPLPYYLASFYHFLGLNFLQSLKLVLITSYMASAFSMYLWLKKHISPKSAFLGAIFYIYAPYHLVDMHFRVDIGEMMAFVFLPLSLLMIDKAIKSDRFLWKFMTGLTLSLLILSHQAVSLLGFPLILLYSAGSLKQKSLKDFFKILTSIFLGLGLSAYYWIPVLLEAKFTHQVTELMSPINFPHLWELLHSSYRYGFLFQGPYGELSPIIGYAQLLVILLAIFLIFKRQANTQLKFFFVVTLIYIILMLDIARPIWNILPTLRKIQFPYRILSVTIFCLSAQAGLVSEKLKSHKLFIFLLTIVIGTSILNWGNRRNIPELGDKEIAKELPLITARGEGLYPAAPIWAPPNKVWQDKVPEKHLEVIEGNLDVLGEKRNINLHSYALDAKQKSLIKENTYYFPGWELKIDGKVNEIDFNNEKYPGIISFVIPEGIHTVKLRFKDTPIRYYSLILTLISVFLSGIYLLYSPASSATASKSASGRTAAAKSRTAGPR